MRKIVAQEKSEVIRKNVANAKAAVKAILTFQNFIKPHNILLNQKQEMLRNATACLYLSPDNRAIKKASLSTPIALDVKTDT